MSEVKIDNVTVLGDYADWFDLQVESADTFLVDALIKSQGKEVENKFWHAGTWNVHGVKPWWFAGYVATMTAAKFSQGFVDTLRLGNGVRDGGWRGYGQDALRLLNVVTLPAGRLLRYAGILRTVQTANSMECALVTTVNALETTGARFWISMSELAGNANKMLETISTYGMSPGTYTKMMTALQDAKIALKEIPGLSTALSDLEAYIKSAPKGASIVTIAYDVEKVSAEGVKTTKTAYHTIYATLIRKGVVGFVETDGGKTVFEGAESLRKVYLNAVLDLDFKPMFLPNATIISFPARAAAIVTGIHAAVDLWFPVVPATSDPSSASGQVGAPTTTAAN